MVTLTRQHLDLVRRIRGIYFGLAPASVAEDLMDAGIAGLVQAALRYQERGATFESYAIWRIRGAMWDYWRVQRRHRLQLVDDWESVEAHVGGEEPIRDWEQTEALESAIAQLPEREQRVIHFSLLGYRQCEIAQMLGVTNSTISRNASTARDKLRLLLDPNMLAA